MKTPVGLDHGCAGQLKSAPAYYPLICLIIKKLQNADSANVYFGETILN